MIFRFAAQRAPKRFFLQKFHVNGIKPVSEEPAFPFQSVRISLFGLVLFAIFSDSRSAVAASVAAAAAVAVAVVVIAAAEPENEKDNDDPAAVVVAIAKNSTVHKDTLLKIMYSESSEAAVCRSVLLFIVHSMPRHNFGYRN